MTLRCGVIVVILYMFPVPVRHPTISIAPMRAPLLFSNEHLADHLELAWLEACQRMIFLKDLFSASCTRGCMAKRSYS
jgi:hypothetical protein